MTKRGRPAILPQEQVKLRDARIELSTKLAIEQIALKDGVSFSEVVRSALRHYVASRSEDSFQSELKEAVFVFEAMKAVSREMDRLIQESEARIAAFDSKLRPQSPASEHTASQEDTNQGKAQ